MRLGNCWFIRFFGLLVISFLTVLACSAENNAMPIAANSSAEGADSENGETATDDVGGSSNSSGIGGTNGGNWYGDGQGDTTEDFTEEDECARERVDPVPIEIEVPVEVPHEVTVPVPIAIYIMLDRSSSMTEVPEGKTEAKWNTAVNSIDAFLTDPESDFLKVGIQHFPIGAENIDEATFCSLTDYGEPAVPVGDLPENATAISSWLSTVEMGVWTPIEPALNGLTSFCAQFQQENTDTKCVGVLISDGAPTRCATDTALVSIAEKAYNDSNIKTFTVGMDGADFNLLDQIAMWGGTDCTPADPNDGFACNVSSGMTLIEAFKAIREVVTRVETKTEMRTEIENRIAECEWGLPDTPEAVGGEGEEFNKNKVNVVFFDPDEGETDIWKIPENTVCGSAGGWFYDDEENPTKIIACEKTCNHITSVVGATIDFVLGCDTLVLLR